MLYRNPIPVSASLVFAHSRVGPLPSIVQLSQSLTSTLIVGPEKKSTQSPDVGQNMDLRCTFASALGNLKPEEHQEMPGVDAPWCVRPLWHFSTMDVPLKNKLQVLGVL